MPYKRVEGHSMNCIGDGVYIFGGNILWLIQVSVEDSFTVL